MVVTHWMSMLAESCQESAGNFELCKNSEKKKKKKKEKKEKKRKKRKKKKKKEEILTKFGQLEMKRRHFPCPSLRRIHTLPVVNGFRFGKTPNSVGNYWQPNDMMRHFCVHFSLISWHSHLYNVNIRLVDKYWQLVRKYLAFDGIINYHYSTKTKLLLWS